MITYPINTPVTFVNTLPSNEIDFQAGGASSGILNKALNFVVTNGGDILYRAVGVDNYLERLAIGSAGSILSSDGTKPIWGTSPTSTSFFSAYVTASIAGIPSSATTSGSPGTWYSLDNTYVTWSTSFPGADPDSVFNVSTGLFTVPADGYYSFDVAITFDSGLGVNLGDGLPLTPLPTGKAVRQAQIWASTGGGTALSTITRQVEGYNGNSTVIIISSAETLLNNGDTISIKVRHDVSASGTVTIGNSSISLPSQTYFSGKRVR